MVVDSSDDIWDQLTLCVEAFSEVWKSASAPPDLAQYVPTSPPTLRRLALVELVKVDLEWRWPRAEWRKTLEQYATELPELSADGRLPEDLVHEAAHIQNQFGESTKPFDSPERFPQPAALVSALLATETAARDQASHARRAAAEFKPGDTVDDFDLLAVLGQGTFGSVFLALQRPLARIVALKITADKGFETQTMAQLDHPHIVRVYDRRQLREQGVQLIYMQFVPGGTLHDVVSRLRETPLERRSGQLLLNCIDEHLHQRNETPPTDSRTRQFLAQCSWPEAVCWLGARLAEALEHAHARGVLHRDLKPANVLLAADGSPKLVDFNISSCQTFSGTSSAEYFGGSIAYMSPEQLDVCCGQSSIGAETLDGRSDLYSLGLVLWELLTGKRLFCEETQLDMSLVSLRDLAAERHQDVGPAEWAKLPHGCPNGLVDAMRACLKAEPSQRVGSAGQLRRQLDLAMHREAYRLINPPAKSWARAIAKHPLPLLLALGLLPNIAASALNIAYNLPEFFDNVHHPDVPRIVWKQLVTINPIAFGLAIAIFVPLAWPVVRAAKRAARDESGAVGLSASIRGRSLKLGDYVAWISGPEWLVSGLVFPLWLQIELGSATVLDVRQYAHFFASQMICGLLAVTLSFLSVTLYTLRYITPHLIDRSQDDHLLWKSLSRLAYRTTRYTWLAFVVVPLALLAISAVHVESRVVFSVLGMVGFAAWAVAILLAREIQRSILSVQIAVNLPGMSSAPETTPSMANH
jgi:serine/threonine protein kinase